MEGCMDWEVKGDSPCWPTSVAQLPQNPLAVYERELQQLRVFSQLCARGQRWTSHNHIPKNCLIRALPWWIASALWPLSKMSHRITSILLLSNYEDESECDGVTSVGSQYSTFVSSVSAKGASSGQLQDIPSSCNSHNHLFKEAREWLVRRTSSLYQY